MGSWPRFIRPQRVARDYNLDAKEDSGKLAKVRRSGCVIVGEVNILAH